jgi:hypothetical protein
VYDNTHISIKDSASAAFTSAEGMRMNNEQCVCYQALETAAVVKEITIIGKIRKFFEINFLAGSRDLAVVAYS